MIGADFKQLFANNNGQAVDLSSTDQAFSPPTQRIFVGGTGNVKVDTAGGQTGVVYTGVAAGTYLTVRATKIYKTGTTATNLVAEW